ncbi:MAG: hypothetical protein QME59_00475 [Candidatus Hydrothermarchaeota archaeon]|nr:hypothetical protein [Candidatus Hydrothermarchaeota archaeon]
MDPKKYKKLYERGASETDVEHLLEKKQKMLPSPPPFIEEYFGPVFEICREDLIRKNVGGGNFLDIGCGSGGLTNFAYEMKAKISIGIDLASPIIRWAKNENKGPIYIVACSRCTESSI